MLINGNGNVMVYFMEKGGWGKLNGKLGGGLGGWGWRGCGGLKNHLIKKNKKNIICSRFMEKSGESFWRKGVGVNGKGSGRGGGKGCWGGGILDGV